MFHTANSAVQGDVSGIRYPYWRVLRRRNCVDNRRLAGLHLHLFHEGTDEGFGFGEFAGLEKLAHVLGEGGDGVGAVQQLPSLRQHGPGVLGGGFQLLPAVAVLQDALRGVGHVQVGGLDKVPDAVHLPLDFFQLGFDGFQVLPLLPCHAVHLLVQQPHQVAYVALGENILADVGDDDVLETLGIQPGRVAGSAALFEEGLADVVGVLAALGFGGGEGLVAGFALGEAAEQVRAGGAAGMGYFRSPRLQEPSDPMELFGRHDGGEGVFHADRLLAVLGVGSPDQGAGVGFVGEHLVDGGLAPLLAPGGGDALGVEGLEDVQGGPALEGQVKDAADHGVVGRVEFQPGPLLGPVLDIDPLVAVGGVGGHPEAARGGFAHSPHNLLGKGISYPINTKNSGTLGVLNWIEPRLKRLNRQQ